MVESIDEAADRLAAELFDLWRARGGRLVRVEIGAPSEFERYVHLLGARLFQRGLEAVEIVISPSPLRVQLVLAEFERCVKTPSGG